MTKRDAVATSVLSVLLIGYAGHRLYVWFITGHLSSRFHPEGQHVSFENDPIGFVLGIGHNGSGILCAVLLLITVLVAK